MNSVPLSFNSWNWIPSLEGADLMRILKDVLVPQFLFGVLCFAGFGCGGFTN